MSRRRDERDISPEIWASLARVADDRKQRRRRERNEELGLIEKSGLLARCREANCGESLLFREPGKPKADFYPSTGAWRVAGVAQTFHGGARGFIAWYAKL
jgi:hypothetical protein